MLLCPWDSPGKNTGVDSHYLLQQTFLTYGSNPCLLHWQTNSLPSEPPWKPTDSLTIATQTPLEILASWFVTEPIFLWFGATKLVVLSDRLPKQWTQHCYVGCYLTSKYLLPLRLVPSGRTLSTFSFHFGWPNSRTCPYIIVDLSSWLIFSYPESSHCLITLISWLNPIFFSICFLLRKKYWGLVSAIQSALAEAWFPLLVISKDG